MIRYLAYAFTALFKSKSRLVAENLCLRQQLVVKPDTVIRWHRKGWKAYWRWRQFLAQHSSETWACDLFTVETLWFRTLYFFFIIHHDTREIVHARVTAHPNAQWLAQQVLEACGLSTESPGFLIHDRDSSFGTVFDRRVESLMNTSTITIDGDRIEAWTRKRPIPTAGSFQKNQPGESPLHRSSAGSIMSINGQRSGWDNVLAPYT